MKIVILDAAIIDHGDLSWKRLESMGELIIYDKTEREEIPDRIRDADILLINGIHHLSGQMHSCKNLKFISVLSTGYNNIDVNLARDLGIIVSNAPLYSTPAVAQFTFALLLEACHHAGEHIRAVKEGAWGKSMSSFLYRYPQIELQNKTIGILGYGNIGKEVGRIAKGFGMKILAYSRNPKNSGQKEEAAFASLEEIYKQADFISLHYPLLPHTEGMINKDAISRMKDGVILINTSRGGLIVEEDLKEALESGKVAFAALDVVIKEPITEDCPLYHAPNVLITPHMAWATKESRERLLNIGIDNVEAYLAGEPVNVVTK